MLFGKPKRVVKRILIVEDEPLVAFDMETMLADEGYEVVATVDKFRTAIQVLDREQVDLVLCDVRCTTTRPEFGLPRKRASAASRCCSRRRMSRPMPTNWRSVA